MEKTQVTYLINGTPECIRNEAHDKYASAKPGTGNAKYAGTPREKRMETALRVKEENLVELHVVIAGVELALKYDCSASGKTWWWSRTLSERETASLFKALRDVDLPTSYAYEQKYEVAIDRECGVRLERYSRKSPLAMWRLRDTTHIGEELVEILS